MLVVLAVEDGTVPFSEAIDEQLDAIGLWWRTGETDEPRFERRQDRASRDRHGVERFLDRSGIHEVAPETPLVVFLTGHGLLGASSKHYLLLQDTDRERLLATALRTNEIVGAALDSYAQDVLVIVNMCEAEGIAGELTNALLDLPGAGRSSGR
ncbi:hypothetical protein NKH77_32600 [Streptomyces sp. M19]